MFWFMLNWWWINWWSAELLMICRSNLCLLIVHGFKPYILVESSSASRPNVDPMFQQWKLFTFRYDFQTTAWQWWKRTTYVVDLFAWSTFEMVTQFKLKSTCFGNFLLRRYENRNSIFLSYHDIVSHLKPCLVPGMLSLWDWPETEIWLPAAAK